jgi:LacI family transcriptional regulator
VRERQLGYLAAVEESGLEASSSAGHTSRDEAADGAIELMSRLDPPFGVLATGNRMFWAVMTAASHLRLSVPRDVAVVTFDGVGDTAAPGLPPTQAVLPVPTMVARALQLLTERENEPDRPYQSVLLDCDIEYGVTCGCVEPVPLSRPPVARRQSRARG